MLATGTFDRPEPRAAPPPPAPPASNPVPAPAPASAGPAATRPAPVVEQSSDPSRALLWTFAAIVCAALLPFFVLLRVSILCFGGGLPAWTSVGLGVAATVALLAGYSWFLGKAPSWRGLLVPVLAFCAYGLIYLSPDRAKTPKIRRAYAQLHPILRLGTASVGLFDRELGVTDASRHKTDYARMGLPLERRSLHFVQKSGYVHAVDLRTNRRGAIRNLLMQLYFSALGFKTLRHTGTSDHLHVSLR